MPMRFRLAPVELSLQIAVTNEAGGKIGWKVPGLRGSYTCAAAQMSALRLGPVWREDDGSYTSDVTIAGQARSHHVSGHDGPRRPARRRRSRL